MFLTSSRLLNLGNEFYTMDVLVFKHIGYLLAEDLGLKGEFSLEWNTYNAGLNHVGVKLSKIEDELVWSWNGSNR